MLRFDADRHEYRYNGRRLPGVTEILGASGRLPRYHHSPVALDLGRRIHHWTLLMDRQAHTHGPAFITEEWRGYLEAYDAWRAAMRPRWRLREQALGSPALGYAGTPDGVGELASDPGGEVVVDLKTGAPAEFHGLQLAAYDLLLGGPHRRRLAVYLRANGGFRQRWFADPQDYVTFLTLLDRFKRGLHGEAEDIDAEWW